MTSQLRLELATHSPLAWCNKGVPHSASRLKVGDIPRQNWCVLRQDLPLPIAVLRDSALSRNSDWMKAFLARNGCVLCPHGKTSMAPQLFQRQLDDGAWGITAATLAQVHLYRQFGVGRVFLANQMVDPHGIEFVLEELSADPEFDFYCLIDSHRTAEILSSAVERFGLERKLQVLIEVGSIGGRTGARREQDCLNLAMGVSQSGHLSLRGIEAYENVFPADCAGEAEAKIRSLIRKVMTIANESLRMSLFSDGVVLISAGGSAYFDVVVDTVGHSLVEPMTLVLRSGCYLTHDVGLLQRSLARMRARTDGIDELGPPPVSALEVWSYIQSCPEPGLAIANVGKRDLSYDFDLPKPILWFRPGMHTKPRETGQRCEVTKLNDQHAYLRLTGGFELAVGDMVALGISHPCTTFDKWPLVYLVDDNYNVIDGIRTYF